jgi:hypothetical protein
MMTEKPVQAESEMDAAAMAAHLTRSYGAKALGRAQMQLYAAVNQRDADRVRFLSRVCMILMQESRDRSPVGQS